jgi:peptidyl-prolyl cis-trans isomerase B (cyclophilin B)
MKDIIIKIISVVAIVSFVVLILFIIPKSTSTTKPTETTTTSMDKEKEYMNGKHHVIIKVKDLGSIKLELDADTAPITVTNFLNLVDQKFYDGLTFHRIIDGFMIQGGDPTGTGMGGSDEKITGEFSSNGITNNISHVRGVISMARSTDRNSASSQFFIVQKDSTYLDGQYAGFGHVTKGMEVVDKVVKSVDGKVGKNGAVALSDQPIIESITRID